MSPLLDCNPSTWTREASSVVVPLSGRGKPQARSAGKVICGVAEASLDWLTNIDKQNPATEPLFVRPSKSLHDFDMKQNSTIQCAVYACTLYIRCFGTDILLLLATSSCALTDVMAILGLAIHSMPSGRNPVFHTPFTGSSSKGSLTSFKFSLVGLSFQEFDIWSNYLFWTIRTTSSRVLQHSNIITFVQQRPINLFNLIRQVRTYY
jgi:hypothetical protein